MNDLHLKILNAIQLRILYTPHAIKQMNAEERLITTKEVKEAILHGEIIEDYPDDKRGHSCLINAKLKIEISMLSVLQRENTWQ